MDKVMKARWVRRLRSGQDQQGRNVLRDKEDKKCCLGVLAEEAGIPCDFSPYTTGGTEGRWKFNFPAGNGVEDAQTLVIQVPDGFYGLNQDEICQLMTLNDEIGFTFAQIADWVEGYL